MAIDSIAASSNLYAIGKMGMQFGTNLMDQGAQKIAQPSVNATESTGNASSSSSSGDPLIGGLLELKQGGRLVESSLKIVETNNKTLGSLFQAMA
jgi:hypothetical protein